MSQPPPLPNSPDELTDPLLNNYIEHFLDIADFRIIDNGKALLDLIRLTPDHPKLKPAIRKVIGLFGCQAPAGRVCALQFLKEALEAGSYFTVESLEKSVLVHFAEIIEYRCSVRNIQRGSTYFCREFDKNISDEQMINLVKLSSTFFRMVHECLYVWGALYFPGSAFDRLRLKLEKKVAFPEFPKDFKFYSQTKVNNFKEKCKDLIRKVQEKNMAALESNSVIQRESVGKDRKEANSPRGIKKTKQPIKPSSKQIKQSTKQPIKQPIISAKQQVRAVKEQAVRDEEQLQRQQKKEALDNPPSSKRTKRHKPKKNKQSKKQFIDNSKEDGSEKAIEANNSKLRKKNSFVEVPFDLDKQIHQQKPNSSKEINKLDEGKSRDLLSKATTLFKPIQQNQESDGGRFSMDEAVSKQSEISEVMYEYNRKDQSPRSQYSLKNQQNKETMLRRENSEQLQPSITVRGKDTKKQVKVIVKQDQPHRNKVKEEWSRQTMVQSKQQGNSTKKQQHSFKLPLNQLKGKVELPIPQSKSQSVQKRQEKERHEKEKERKGTGRKKFVSSQEQSMKEVRQEQANQQIPKTAKHFNNNSSLQYQNDTKNNVKVLKHPKKEEIEQKQQKNVSSSPNTKQSQYQITKQFPAQQQMAVKASKPIKLKSNSNLKTVFESSGYKVVEVQNKNDDQVITKQGNAVNNISNQQKQSQQNSLTSGSNKNSKSTSQVPASRKQAKKTSIFQSVQVDTIQTINSLTPLTRKPDTNNTSPAKLQLHEVPEQPAIKTTIRREQSSEKPKDDREDTHRQVKSPIAGRDQRSTSLQSKPFRKEPQEQTLQYHHHQPILHHSRQTPDEKRSMEVRQQQLRPIRRNSTFSSRFRHFKEVNLFIQPKTTLPIQPSQSLITPPPTIDPDLKLHFIQELNKIKTAIIQKQQAMNLTLMSLRSEIVPDRKISEQTKIETGTQTKLRHKSKNKFERKNKYKLLDDLSKSQQNTSLINLPKQPPQQCKETPLQAPSSSMQGKKSRVQRQQLKPNTLLHALYKRKYSNI